jgi:hypothetical protein
VLVQIPDPAPDLQDITWDGSTLWVTSYQTNRIYQLDASTGAVLKSFAAPDDKAKGLAWDGQHLWHSNEHGMLYKINPNNGEVLETIQGFVYGSLLTWDGHSLWAGGSRPRRLDLQHRTETMSFPCPAEWAKGIAWDGRHIWCAGFEDDTLYQINATPGGATLSGRVLKNGVPLAGIQVESHTNWHAWENRVMLGKTWTDANGEYQLPADLGITHSVVAWGDDSDPEQLRWMWYSIDVPSAPIEHTVPDLNAAYDGLLSPADGSSFSDVSPANPVQFSWSALPDYQGTYMRMAEVAPYSEVWYSPWGANTSATFYGTLDDETQIQPGDYLWQSIFHLNNGWHVQSKYWYFTITAQGMLTNPRPAVDTSPVSAPFDGGFWSEPQPQRDAWVNDAHLQPPYLPGKMLPWQ